ncbi:unnamed protein product [Periconia digitata]|uniref:Zn(2)-C6 fungal-type domain-containing protein n=1 Tax=Periconia digitata TaxID=1303443 RepID=A0A9W4UCL1_9PLEO|nr:unnamed protein product [Periconia digitata]
MTTIKKAKSNCWTCKERKVGCDRALPTCGNCARARRACKAYGVKLAWPDKFDGRRKQKEWKSDPDVSSSFIAFLPWSTGICEVKARVILEQER